MAKAMQVAKPNARGTTAKRTSVGLSNNSRPKNKHSKRMTKPYRGQGQPR